MRRRMSSALCLVAICVAAGLSAFLFADCCEADADCAPCASILCWVGESASGPRLTGPEFHEHSGSATQPVSIPGLISNIVGTCPSAIAGEPSDTSPSGFRLPLRV